MESAPTSYVLPRLIIIMVECVLYGVYAVLFGVAIWTLPNRFHVSSVKIFFFPVIIVLFVLATLNFFYDLVGEAYAILFTIPVNVKPWMTAGETIDTLTYSIADILGDMLLFYRVYAVWGYRKKVLFPLLLLILVAKAFNVIYTAITIQDAIDVDKPLKLLPTKLSFPDLFFILNAIANMSMTLMIAGRVWWISRTIQSGTGRQSQNRWYHRTIAIITESGLIYPVYLITEAALSADDLNPTTIGIIAVGIAPTLVAVRVGSGSAYDNRSLDSMKHEQVSTFRPGLRSFRGPDFAISDSDMQRSSNLVDNSSADSVQGIREEADKLV
ncbi:hypothetical protein D9757_012493 [Collybiopsis confluens]|uniref:Uncharacterized protein n=1 Tax=Collybiopsis confluens TaxID=2823264 RepID=A0A8H5LPI7_9AGAR|nr:hypothetical protein D9757_012493 [Collybiopsis confluens]